MSTLREFVEALWDRDHGSYTPHMEQLFTGHDAECAVAMHGALDSLRELAECPIESAVGIASMEVLFAARAFIDLLTDADDSELHDVSLAAIHQCRVFFYG
jgi:hypothetical protein